jgi:outer membrane protein OmpA-like peptidoglycan-associated protein
MTRWLWLLLVVAVIVAVVFFFWPSSNRTTTLSPVAQSPSPTAAPTPVAQSPSPTAAPTPVAQSPSPTAAPTPVAQSPSPTLTSTPVAQSPTAAPTTTPADQTTPVPAPAATPADQAVDAASRANDKATTELASLKSGFGAKELIAALNDSVVNFGSASAEVPASMATFLEKAAEDLKQLPAGDVLEIAGYTDVTGNAADNVTLSQKRADAVREALIKYGANPAMLIAKGYGNANPIASNDTPEGRLRNRRIEYHIIKTP